jgi:hypothetical protein
LFDTVNLVSAMVVVLQGIGSGWTKHKMNLLLYIFFYLVAIVQEWSQYSAQVKADEALNKEVYEAVRLGSALTVSEGEVRLPRVPAEVLGLGFLVKVRPGQRVPVDGFVIQPCEGVECPVPTPFSYAVTGEATVIPGVLPLPIRWDQITEIECAINESHVLDTAPLPDHAGSDSPTPSMMRRVHSGLTLPDEDNSDAAAAEAVMRPLHGSSFEALVDKPGPLHRRSVVPLGRSHSASHSQPSHSEGAPARGTGGFLRDVGRTVANEARSIAEGMGTFGASPSKPPRPSAIRTPSESSVKDKPESPVISTLSSSNSIVPPVQYLINSYGIPTDVDPLSRGMVHAPSPGPDGRLRDLYVLAGVPARFSPSEGKAKDPPSSAWQATVRSVMIAQLVIMTLVSVQGWASGTAIRDIEINLWTAVAFLAGQLVMTNGLIPVRAKLATQLWLEICKLLYPAITVKNDVVLETLRLTTNVVSDKTGTLTVDGMAYASPQPTPWVKGPTSAFLMLLTNDSCFNELFSAADSHVDERLASAPALCTTSEEGVIFDALTADRENAGTALLEASGGQLFQDESRSKPKFPLVFHPLSVPGPNEATHDASDAAGRRTPPSVVAFLVSERTTAVGNGRTSGHPGGAAWSDSPPLCVLLGLMHYKGPFEPSFVARFAVATVFQREVRDRGEAMELVGRIKETVAASHSDGLCGSAEGDIAILKALNKDSWVPFHEKPSSVGPLSLKALTIHLVVQGGGDVVARRCGEEAARFEQHCLEVDPNRTIGHASATLSPSSLRSYHLSGSLDRSAVVEAFERSSAPDAPSLQLDFLSKFENPLCADVHAVPGLLASQQVRFHCCTGDTLLTMRAILQRMGVSRPIPLDKQSDREALATMSLALPALVEQCGAASKEAREQVERDLLRTYEVHWGEKEAERIREHVLGSIGGISGPDCLGMVHRMLFDDKLRVVLLCSHHVLLVLHELREYNAVSRVLNHPDAVFAFYRIRQTLKPLALDLFMTSPDDEVSPPPIFIGDGTNDEKALLMTEHSVAIRCGSQAARNASNVEVSSAAALPDIISMSKLNHGGRGLVLRDVLFVGGYLVAMLAVAAHLVRFEPMSKDTLVVVADPWSPATTVLYTMLVHSPRMLIVAVTDGMQEVYQDHSTLVGKALAETFMALASAVWVGVNLAPADDQRGDPVAMKEFAVMAVASMALIVYLRQNLVISFELRIRPRLLPPLWSTDDEASLPQPATQGMRIARHRHLPVAVWLLTGVLAQAVVFLLFCGIITSNTLPLQEVVYKVMSASLAPAAAFALYRLVLELSRWNSD